MDGCKHGSPKTNDPFAILICRCVSVSFVCKGKQASQAFAEALRDLLEQLIRLRQMPGGVCDMSSKFEIPGHESCGPGKGASGTWMLGKLVVCLKSPVC